ncbi:camphor resistance protein CrcB [Roseovarius sp. 217]|nr:camphor resistance protein CrcB [Roseovarius sp. 217]
MKEFTMKRFLVAAAITLTAFPALGDEDDIIKVKSTSDVATTMDRLEAAVTGAGATVFARVDHAEGAASVDLALDPSQVLIFGNPKMGTAAMQDDPVAGLFLPMKVLVYQDGAGETWLVYQDPEDMFEDTGINDDADYIKMMTGALGKLTAKAAEQ